MGTRSIGACAKTRQFEVRLKRDLRDRRRARENLPVRSLPVGPKLPLFGRRRPASDEVQLRDTRGLHRGLRHGSAGGSVLSWSPRVWMKMLLKRVGEGSARSADSLGKRL